jgi:hypothetical protein
MIREIVKGFGSSGGSWTKTMPGGYQRLGVRRHPQDPEHFGGEPQAITSVAPVQEPDNETRSGKYRGAMVRLAGTSDYDSPCCLAVSFQLL